MRKRTKLAESPVVVAGGRADTAEPDCTGREFTGTVETPGLQPAHRPRDDGAGRAGARRQCRLAGYIVVTGNRGGQATDTLLAPNDDQVGRVIVLPQTVAALKFNGDRNPRAAADRIAELRTVLRDHAITPIGGGDTRFYDPPWTLRCRRRDEVPIPVES